MTANADALFLLRTDDPTADRAGADRPFAIGTMARLLTGLATCRLVERRLLAFATVLSECLPAREREGRAPETSVHDLLVDPDAAGDVLVGRCLEAVAGEPLADIVQREVVEPAGLATTSLLPQPTSSPEDLDRLLGLLAGEDLLGADCRRLLLARGYGVIRTSGGALGGYGCEGIGPDGAVLAHHYPQLGLTVVARRRPAALAAVPATVAW